VDLEIGGRLGEQSKERSRDAVSNRDEIGEALTSIFRQLSVNSTASPGSPADVAGSIGTLSTRQAYDETSGTALFLAAYYNATNDAVAHGPAMRCATQLHFLLKQTTTLGQAQPDVSRVGGLAGLSSVLYILVRLATWLNMKELLNLATDVANSITPGQILSEELDVMCGCAGTLLSLLSFAEEGEGMGIDTGRVSDLAVLCGQHLLDRRTYSGFGPRAWPGKDSPQLPGFAHGAAGISYALVRLFQHTGQARFRDAAMEGFAFERTLYLPELATWLDPRCNRPLNKASWCEGAPGIALSRLGCIGRIDSHALRHDLEEALSITRSLPEGPLDDLCCGTFGRVEIMHTAGLVLGRLHLTERARELARSALSRAAIYGWRFQSPTPHYDAGRCNIFGLCPSLLSRLPGVGYALLRLNYPDLFPSVLLLEAHR